MSKFLVLLNLFILGVSVDKANGQVSITWTMSRDTIELGDSATLRIIFRYDPETKVYTFPHLQLGTIDEVIILDSTEWIKYKESPLVEWDKSYTLLHLQTDTIVFEPMRTAYLYNAQYDTARSKPIIYEVYPPANTGEELEDIKDLERIPNEGTSWTWIIGILLFVFSFIYVLWHLRQKSQVAPKQVEEIGIKIAKIDDIKSKLQHLKMQVESSKIAEKEGITDLTVILKEYLGYLNSMPLLPKTTETTLKILRQRLNGDSYFAMEQVLFTADMVKFAQYTISKDDLIQMIQTGEYLVGVWYKLHDSHYTQSLVEGQTKGGKS